MVAVRVSELPMTMVVLVVLSDMSVTAMVVVGAAMTVTAQVAVFVGSDAEETVMVVVPVDTAVTTPSVTVATSVLLLDQLTDLFVASAGVTVANSGSVLPMTMVVLVMLSDMPVTATVTAGAAVTVTAQVAVFVGSDAEVTVMVVVPADMAVTIPSATVATVGSLLDHETILSVAAAGMTAAVSAPVLPAISSSVVGESVIPETDSVVNVMAPLKGDGVPDKPGGRVVVKLPAAGNTSPKACVKLPIVIGSTVPEASV